MQKGRISTQQQGQQGQLIQNPLGQTRPLSAAAQHLLRRNRVQMPQQHRHLLYWPLSRQQEEQQEQRPQTRQNQEG